jgi:hypothetical protein
MTKDTPDTPPTEPRWPDAFNRVIAERNEARQEVLALKARLMAARHELAQCLGFIRTETPSARGTIEHLLLIISEMDRKR